MTLGARLQQARKARKLSLADVTRQTKIQGWVLETLEADRVPEQMSPIYVRGFLSTYARFLHLDPAPLLAELQWPAAESTAASSRIPAVRAAAEEIARLTAVEEAPAAASIPAPEPKIPVVIRWPSIRLPSVPLPLLKQLATVATSIAMVMWLGAASPWQRLPKVTLPKIAMPHISIPKFTLAKSESKPVKTASKSVAKRSKMIVTAKKVDTAKPAAQIAKSEPAPEPAPLNVASIAPVGEPIKPVAPPLPTLLATQPLQLDVNASRTTWIQVRADGKLISQQRLSRGAHERWTAKNKFELVIAKPSEVELLLNGQSISPFALAHRGRLLITHQGITELQDER